MKVARTGRRIGAAFLALLTGISVPLLIWIGMFVAFLQMFAEWRVTRARLSYGPVCRADSDCPSGYECVGGKCVLIAFS